MTVEQKVMNYLKTSGITQRHISRITGINPSILSLTLKGKRRMQIDELMEISDAIGKRPSYFLDNNEETTVSPAEQTSVSAPGL